MARASNRVLRIDGRLQMEYLKKRMRFREEQWVMPEPDWDDKLLGEIMEPWQKKLIFEPLDTKKHTLESCPDPVCVMSGGKKVPVACPHLVYNLYYIQLPKKFSKTTVIGGEMFTELYFAQPGIRIYGLAGDKDQAGLLFEETAGFIRRNPNMQDKFKILQSTIWRLDSKGNRISSMEKMSSDAYTTSGVGPDFFLFDEFWNQPNRELWDTCYMGTAAKKNWKGIILTNAGFDEETICYEVRELCRSGEFSNFYYCEPVKVDGKDEWENKDGTIPMTIKKPAWISDSWVKMQYKTQPKPVIQRWVENKWSGKTGALFEEDKVKGCLHKRMKPQYGGVGNYFLGVDVGTSTAKTVALVIHREVDGLKLDNAMMWQGTPDEKVPMAEVGGWIETQCDNFRETKVVADPWQMTFLIQLLRQKGIDVEEWPGTEANIIRLSNILFDVISNGYFRMYAYDPLKKDLLHAEASQKNYGWRLSRKYDWAIALGMAAAVCMGNVDWEGEPIPAEVISANAESRIFTRDMREFDFGKNRRFTAEEEEPERPYWTHFD